MSESESAELSENSEDYNKDSAANLHDDDDDEEEVDKTFP